MTSIKFSNLLIILKSNIRMRIKFTIGLLSIAFFILYSNPSQSQIGGFLKEKAKKTIVKNLKRGEEENQTQQQQEAVEEEPQQEVNQQKQDPANNFMQQKMLGLMGMNNVKYDPAYTYTSIMSTDIEWADSTGNEINKGSYAIYFDKNSKNFAIEFKGLNQETGNPEKSYIIYDYKNYAMLILSEKDGEKSGMAMAIPRDSSEVETNNDSIDTEVSNEDLSAYNMLYKKTGRTKTILGYNCNEYAYEYGEGRAEIWATNDIKFNYADAYQRMYGFQYLATGGTAYLLGTVLEMNFKDVNSNAYSKFTVKEINPNTSKTISIADFQVMGVGGAQ